MLRVREGSFHIKFPLIVWIWMWKTIAEKWKIAMWSLSPQSHFKLALIQNGCAKDCCGTHRVIKKFNFLTPHIIIVWNVYTDSIQINLPGFTFLLASFASELINYSRRKSSFSKENVADYEFLPVQCLKTEWLSNLDAKGTKRSVRIFFKNELHCGLSKIHSVHTF